MSKSPSEYNEERQRFVADASAHLKNKFMPSTSSDPVLKMMTDWENVIVKVLAMCRPIQQAGGAIKPDDLLALRDHVFAWSLEQFDSWGKDQLVMLITTLNAERIMQAINDDPWGSGVPEALT